MVVSVSPPRGKITNWRAGCGKSARPVRREGGPNSIGSPYPYRRASVERIYRSSNSKDIGGVSEIQSLKALKVLESGLFTLVVDGGRPDSRRLGVPVGGAADRFAQALGN